MKQKIKFVAILFCYLLTANTFFAQKHTANTEKDKDIAAEIKKHFAQLKGAYNPYFLFVLNAEKQYIVDNLNFRVLYNSPLYKDYLQYWAGIYQFTTTSKEQFEEQFKNDILKTLARLVKQNETPAAQNLAKDLTDFNITLGFNNTAVEIVKYMQTIDNEFINKNRNLNRMLTSAQLLEYKIPPKIVGLQEDVYKNCLIIFMDSDCDHCRAEIAKIIKNYDKLLQRGIRVISIAADIDKAKYEKYSAKFLWQDKLCDFEGLSGKNFNNYGVVGTPTIFLTDNEGKIVGDFTFFDDIFK